LHRSQGFHLKQIARLVELLYERDSLELHGLELVLEQPELNAELADSVEHRLQQVADIALQEPQQVRESDLGVDNWVVEQEVDSLAAALVEESRLAERLHIEVQPGRLLQTVEYHEVQLLKHIGELLELQLARTERLKHILVQASVNSK
jgi:hypothetical protein